MAFPSETDVVLLISDNSVSFEASSLTGLGLLLYGFDFHNFLLEDVFAEKGINNFLFLDWD